MCKNILAIITNRMTNERNIIKNFKQQNFQIKL